MKLATTTSDFDKITDSYFERVKLVVDAGFRYIDLSLYTLKEDDPLFFSDGWRTYAEELLAYTKSLGACFVQCHSPNTNNLDGDAGFADAVWKTVRAIEICGILGIENLVVHAGYSPAVTDKEEWFVENRRFYRELFPAMERCGVNVLCENTTKANMPNWYYLVTGADTREFVKFVDHPRFGACWDTGHANVEGPQYGEIVALGDALFAIHFNDNRGTCDEHLAPFMGTMSIDEVMHALLDIGFSGPLTFECESGLRPSHYWFGDRVDYATDRRFLEPTLAARMAYERYLFALGEKILTTYGVYDV